MSEEVVTQPGDESPEAVEAPTTQPDEDVTTLKNRLRGKDQALTRTTQERDALRLEAETLRREKAEREKAELSEYDRAVRERDEARAEAAKAREEAKAAQLLAKYPNAVAFLDGEPMPSEAKLAALEQTLAAKAAPAEPEPEPLNLPDRARKAPTTTAPQNAADLLGALDAMGPMDFKNLR